MPRQDLSKGERVYDKWFHSLPAKRKRELRKQGLGPHGEKPVEDTVFPVIDEHPAWSSGKEVEEPVSVTERFISEDEVRLRLRKVFDVIARYADPKSAAYFAFIRKLLGASEGPSIAAMGKVFGITQQACMWRARQIKAALGSIADAPATPPAHAQLRQVPPDTSWYKPRTTRDPSDDLL